MGTKKKGMELVFNLQWTHMPDNGGNKSNIIGMYDTPATTSNFEKFKSYLLKNSGVAGNDVKVTFVIDNGPEWVIESQSGFEIALAAFRLKARVGEVIFLKVDKISDSKGSPRQMDTRKLSNDVETQFDNETAAPKQDVPPEWFINYMKQFKRDVVEEVTYAVSLNILSKPKDKEAPPQGPIISRRSKPELSKRSKKHITVGEHAIDKDLLRTLKYDRKLEVKLDKLDAKAKKIKEKKQALFYKVGHEDNLGEFSFKQNYSPIQLAKSATLGDVELSDSASSCYENIDVNGRPIMNATLAEKPINGVHAKGGEVIIHHWKVQNTGTKPWDSRTTLNLSWGTIGMTPYHNIINCPHLKPGEIGTIEAYFKMSEEPGRYESYWNFFHGGFRFGQFLSFHCEVDEPYMMFKLLRDLDEIERCSPSKDEIPRFDGKDDCVMDLRKNMDNLKLGEAVVRGGVTYYPTNRDNSLTCRMITVDAKVGNVDETGVIAREEGNSDTNNVSQASNKYGITEEDLIVDLSTNSKDTESENKSLITEGSVNLTNADNNNNGSTANNNSSNGSICEVGSQNSDLSSGYDVVTPPACDEKEMASDYIYVTIDGNQLPLPKHMLPPDFAENASAASKHEEQINKPTQEEFFSLNPELVTPLSPEAAQLAVDISNLEQNIEDTKSFMTHCSTMGTCFSDTNSTINSRLFIMPENSLGYEVIDRIEEPTRPSTGNMFEPPYPTVVSPTDSLPTYTWAQSRTQYTLADIQNAGGVSNLLKCDPYGPVDQQNSHSTDCSTAPKAEFQHVPNFQQSASTGDFQHVPNLQQSASTGDFQHIPNVQQSVPKTTYGRPRKYPATSSPSSQRSRNENVPVHILPENLVSGAVNVASSAINTARSVINMIVPPKSEPGRWVNGHWVTENPESPRAKNLRILADMGFWDTDLNATLLARYNDDVARVVGELVQ